MSFGPLRDGQLVGPAKRGGRPRKGRGVKKARFGGKKGHGPQVKVRQSDLGGVGVFARRAISEGEVAAVFNGVAYYNSHDNMEEFVAAHPDIKVSHAISMPGGWVVDGARAPHGYHGHQLNTSRDPVTNTVDAKATNCRIVKTAGDLMNGKGPVARFVAKRDIKAGEELLWDYGSGYWPLQDRLNPSPSENPGVVKTPTQDERSEDGRSEDKGEGAHESDFQAPSPPESPPSNSDRPDKYGRIWNAGRWETP